MIRATFVMEQHLGHQTYYQNLRRFVDADSQVDATWVPVTYRDPAGIWERVPGLPGRLRGTLTGRQQVRRSLDVSGSDVLFFNTQVPAVLGSAQTRYQPYLIATDITPIQYDGMAQQYNHSPDTFAPIRDYKHRANVATFRGAAKLLPWSSWTGQSLVRDYGVDPSRDHVVPPGVDLQRWCPGAERPDGRLRILFVGGDFERKGGRVLLTAFQSLPAGSAELHIVTRSSIPQVDGVVVYHNMTPNTPELIALFHACDVFVLPTEAEAFGIAAVEASAAGLPVIATSVGGLTDIVAENETGFLIPPRDVVQLAARLRLLAEDAGRRQRMGRAGRARAEAHFDARRNAARVIECLHEAVYSSRRISSTLA